MIDLPVSCSSTRTRGGAARTFPISPQTVMSAMCQPSLEPAVPLASVAPATCPSNQRDPVDASGTRTQSLAQPASLLAVVSLALVKFQVTLCGKIVMISRAMRATGRHMMKSTSVSGEIYGMEHADGSQSDTALGSLGSGIKKRRSSLSQRVVAILPSRRSRSTSQLSQTGLRTV